MKSLPPIILLAGLAGCGGPQFADRPYEKKAMAEQERVSAYVAPGVVRLADGSCLDGHRAPEGWTLHMPYGGLALTASPDLMGLTVETSEVVDAQAAPLAETPGYSLAGWSTDLDDPYVIARPERIDQLVRAIDVPRRGSAPPIWARLSSDWAAEYPELETYQWWDGSRKYLVSRDRHTQCMTTVGVRTGAPFIQCKVVNNALDAQASIQLPVKYFDDLPGVLSWAPKLLDEIRGDCPAASAGQDA